MRAIKNAYTHLGDYIKSNVLDSDDNSVFKHIDLWNGQTEHLGDDGKADDDPIDLPALFIEFDVDKINNVGTFQVDLDVTITFYVAFETLYDTNIESDDKDNALEFLEIISKLHEMIQAYTNEQCGSLNVLNLRRYKTKSNLFVYMMSYSTTLRDTSAFDKRRDTVTTPVDPDIEIKITKRPHTKPNTSGSGETYFDIS